MIDLIHNATTGVVWIQTTAAKRPSLMAPRESWVGRLRTWSMRFDRPIPIEPRR